MPTRVTQAVRILPKALECFRMLWRLVQEAARLRDELKWRRVQGEHTKKPHGQV